MNTWHTHSVLSLLLILLMPLPGCSKRPRTRTIRKKVTLTRTFHSPATHKKNQPSPPITVWVHGTYLLRRPLFHSFFEGKSKLKKASDLEQRFNLRVIADTLSHIAPDSFHLKHFYLFGWSGRLNAIEREEAATALRDQLQELVTAYKKTYSTPPSIQILAHSHGGNVVLNLAKVTQDKAIDFVIEKLILLACPVQTKTVNYIQNPLFKKVYALYSSLDLVQVLAPQMLHRISQTEEGTLKAEFKIPTFSKRRFPFYDNLLQVKIKINGRAIMHTEFTKPRFLTALPNIIGLMDIWHDKELRNMPIADTTKLLCVYTHKQTLTYDATSPI